MLLQPFATIQPPSAGNGMYDLGSENIGFYRGKGGCTVTAIPFDRRLSKNLFPLFRWLYFHHHLRLLHTPSPQMTAIGSSWQMVGRPKYLMGTR